MKNWRTRLLAAIDKDGRSDRAISLAAKLGPNFVNELRNTDKEPGVGKVIKLADELKLSSTYVFTGVNLTPEDQELLELFLKLSPESRTSLVALAQQLAATGRA